MKLQLYILRELLVSFAFTVGGMLVLALPAIAVAVVHKLAGVDMKAILSYVPLVLAGLVPYLLPLGFLLAVVATYGRLAADNEWTAIKMSGTHPLKMYVPGLVLGIPLWLVTFWLVSEKLPEIRRAQDQFKIKAAGEMLRNLSPGRTEISIGSFFMSSKLRDGHDFLDALIYVPPRPGSASRQIVAKRVSFEFHGNEMLTILEDAHTVIGQQELHSGRTVLRFDLDELVREKERKYASARFKNYAAIRAEIQAPTTTPKIAEVLRFELHYRAALASTYLMFLLLGAPTGIFLRRGTQLLALATAVGYSLLYYLLSMRLGMQLAHSHVLPPEIAAWAVVGFGTLAGSYLTLRAVRA